jgi:hypothetical protein
MRHWCGGATANVAPRLIERCLFGGPDALFEAEINDRPLLPPYIAVVRDRNGRAAEPARAMALGRGLHQIAIDARHNHERSFDARKLRSGIT